ncbi:MAG: HD domain-containing protein [Lachnospiraceae bacterium]|nr:HD domain-containing protein [Lachnospiraceae bacterium]MBD5455358.1 HD domain-containing protein [Lachnospiraceae bacterium]
MPKYDNLAKELQEKIIEDRQNHWVNPYAFQDENVLRRRMDHDKANLWRPAFVRDAEKIMHIPYYNRYADKTQVFSLYKNDDISRRSQHVQLVSRIARNIGSVLGLNVDLIEAIALGHDIGHTPFGHAGEKMLNDLYYEETGRYFNHNIHSARVLDKIFPLNLSMQSLDGIICHNGELELKEYRPKKYSDFKLFDEKMDDCYTRKGAIKELVPATLEGCVVRVSDIIAYLGKDRQDALKLGIYEDSPDYYGGNIGTTNAEIINNMSVNIIKNSYGKDYLKMDDDYFEAFKSGKKENYQKIYGNEKLEAVYKEQIGPMFRDIYDKLLGDMKKHDRSSVVYTHHIDYLKGIIHYYADAKVYEESDPNDIVVDYMASMTDDYFIDLYNYLFPKGSHKVDYIGYFE